MGAVCLYRLSVEKPGKNLSALVAAAAGNAAITPSGTGPADERTELRQIQDQALLVSFNWTEIRNIDVLMAAVIIQGPPLCWGNYYDKTLGKSQNAFGEALLLVLREMLRSDVKVILLADRGFGRTELSRFCQQVGFEYIIRIKDKV